MAKKTEKKTQERVLEVSAQRMQEIMERVAPVLHGLNYDKVYDVQDISVWGGLTFSEKKADCQWDGSCVEVIGGGSFDDIPGDWWVFGFDTMHYNDGPEHDREWCIRETRQLQLQLDAIKNKEAAPC